jgi:hypothetical protein
VAGVPTVRVLEAIVGTLLDKPGGYIANDRLPPGVLLDNMPAFERGVLAHVRDMSRALRRDFSRSQSQAVEDPDLVRAESRFHFDYGSWLLPSSEGEYRTGLAALASYRQRLSTPEQPGAWFFPRHDNLARWLEDVSTRLDSQTARLGLAVEGGSATTRARTPWLDVDDVFYEARGYSWALQAQLRAVQVDFADVLAERQAAELLAQVVRELEGTQRPVRSPLILNGSEYGLLANHSLVMAGYLSRAGAAVLLLRERLGRG